MSTERDGHDRTTQSSKSGLATDGRDSSSERDPRKRDQQDLRTAGSHDAGAKAKDDPSRAPESGAP